MLFGAQVTRFGKANKDELRASFNFLDFCLQQVWVTLPPLYLIRWACFMLGLLQAQVQNMPVP